MKCMKNVRNKGTVQKVRTSYTKSSLAILFKYKINVLCKRKVSYFLNVKLCKKDIKPLLQNIAL